LQQGHNKEHIELDVHSLLSVVNQVETLYGAFQKSKDKLYLPPVGIEHNYLKSGEIQAVSE